MPFDPSQDPLDPLVSQPRRAPPALMIAGMVGACTLGGALGLWARPTDDDVKLLGQRTASAPASAAQPRQIEIRVDHPPTATAAAEPVASAPAAPVAEAPSEAIEAPESQPELLAPKRQPAGLVKVHAVAPERLARPDEAEEGRTRLAAQRKAQAKAAAERKSEAAREAREAEAREARAEAKAAELRKTRKEAARIAEAAEDKARAKAERRLAERKAADQLAAKQAAAEKREARLAAERKAQKLAEQKLAEQKRKAAAKTLAATAPAAKTVKVAKASTRCASADPGAALTCSDPALSAAERQMSRAYRQAEAAGVPSETLERQQQRWLAARANAARKAPWAVHDIYLARIAELQDQTRQAGRSDDF